MGEVPIEDPFRRDCEQAIKTGRTGDLFGIALRMRLQGLEQMEAMNIICAAKESVTGSRIFGDDPRDEDIENVLECVTGWCPVAFYIWHEDYIAAEALARFEDDQRKSEAGEESA